MFSIASWFCLLCYVEFLFAIAWSKAMGIDIIRLILLAALASLSFSVQPAQSQTTNLPPSAPLNLRLKIFPNMMQSSTFCFNRFYW
jgi:hypothetical protein